MGDGEAHPCERSDSIGWGPNTYVSHALEGVDVGIGLELCQEGGCRSLLTCTVRTDRRNNETKCAAWPTQATMQIRREKANDTHSCETHINITREFDLSRDTAQQRRHFR